MPAWEVNLERRLEQGAAPAAGEKCCLCCLCQRLAGDGRAQADGAIPRSPSSPVSHCPPPSPRTRIAPRPGGARQRGSCPPPCTRSGKRGARACLTYLERLFAAPPWDGCTPRSPAGLGQEKARGLSTDPPVPCPVLQPPAHFPSPRLMALLAILCSAGHAENSP